MDALLELSWRLYPALALALGGAWLIVRALRSFGRSRRYAQDPERALLVARSFRIGILGLCACVFAAAWIWQVGWLAVVALIVLGEEMLETSVMVAALEDGRRMRARNA
jgi:hypothetical protein